MCIGSGVLTDLFRDCPDLIDGKTLNITDLDLAIVACNGGTKKNHLIPSQAISRHQLMEVLTRLALDKYYKTGVAADPPSALELLLHQNILPHFSKFNSHHFRKERLWREENDVVYTRLLPAVQKLYEANTGKLAAPGKHKTPMCLDEFVEMMLKAGLVDDHFGQREIGPCFNLAQETVKNESLHEHHLDMKFVEFLEALARCADKFELEYLRDHFPDLKAKSPYGLDKKIECVVFQLLQAHLGEKAYDIAYKKYEEKVKLELDNVGVFKMIK